METIGSRISAFREALHLKQVDIFHQTGIKQQTLSSIESGTEPKSGVVAALLAGYPKLNPEWLLLGVGPMLRDGKALAPLLPTPGLTSGPATVAEAENVLLRQQVARMEADIEWLRDQLGKLPGSFDAAGSAYPVPRHPAGFAQAARQEVAEVFDAYVERQLERVLLSR